MLQLLETQQVGALPYIVRDITPPLVAVTDLYECKQHVESY